MNEIKYGRKNRVFWWQRYCRTMCFVIHSLFPTQERSQAITPAYCCNGTQPFSYVMPYPTSSVTVTISRLAVFASGGNKAVTKDAHFRKTLREAIVEHFQFIICLNDL